MNDDQRARALKQLTEAANARSAYDVVRIFPSEDAPGGDGRGDGFFAGSGGDETLWEALSQAGWEIIWDHGSSFAAKAPDSSVITFADGDIHLGDINAIVYVYLSAEAVEDAAMTLREHGVAELMNDDGVIVRLVRT